MVLILNPHLLFSAKNWFPAPMNTEANVSSHVQSHFQAWYQPLSLVFQSTAPVFHVWPGLETLQYLECKSGHVTSLFIPWQLPFPRTKPKFLSLPLAGIFGDSPMKSQSFSFHQLSLECMLCALWTPLFPSEMCCCYSEPGATALLPFTHSFRTISSSSASHRKLVYREAQLGIW